jgi:hypothetical protein
MFTSPSAKAAGRAALDFLLRVRRPDGRYELGGWPRAGRRRSDDSAAAGAVPELRYIERTTLGFLDPIEDAVFLTAGLRRMGFAATLHLGRQIAPAGAPGGFHAWVQCGDHVLSTSLPVRDEYVTVYQSPDEEW